MFKKLKIKNILSLLLVLLLSVNSFISHATSNDGSSFITKAEFDSLKNTFQSQLDEYNKSIDSKIDDAIAAYLNGVKSITKVKMDNLLEKYQVTGCSGGIAWDKSTTYVTNANEKQKLAWDLTIFGARAANYADNKGASYKNYKSNTWEKRLLADDNTIVSFNNWEPRLTGSGIGITFYLNASAAISIHDTSNTWTFYDNLNLTKDNRKNTLTVAGGFQNKSYYEATMYSITYAEYKDSITDPYVISPYSTADELIVDSGENFTLSDTTTLVDPETSADFTKGALTNCTGVSASGFPTRGASTSGYRMAAKIGLKAVKRNTLETKDLTDLCAGNGAMSSGLVLCIPQDKGKLYGRIKGSATGTVLMWQGDKTSTYSSSTKKTSFSVDTTFKDFEFKDLDAKTYVRIIFEPDSDTESIVIEDLYMDIEK